MKKAAIIFIGTNAYVDFFKGFYEAVNSNFCPEIEKTFFVFTDDPENEIFSKSDVVVNKVKHEEWPYITLYRFKFMSSVEGDLLKFDYTFFIDADLWPTKEIRVSELFDDNDFVTVQHPGFVGKIGTFETNVNSTANVLDKKYDLTNYRQGCFWGGKSEPLSKMVDFCRKNVETDMSNGVMACWHDESHMNKFFLNNLESTKTLHPGYATPQEGYQDIKSRYEMKMVHLHKDISEFPRFAGAGR